MARYGNNVAARGVLAEEEPQGVLSGLGQGGLLSGLGQGGLLAGLQNIRNREPGQRPFLDLLGSRSGALFQAGTGVLMAPTRKMAAQAWQQGMATGGQADAYRNKERADARAQAKREQALATVMASLQEQGKLPSGMEGLAGLPEIAAPLIVDAMKPPPQPDPFTLSPGETRFGSDGRPIASMPSDATARPPQVVEIFDEQTGRPYKATWNPQTQTFDRVGGTQAPSGPLVSINGEGAEGKLREKLFGAEGEQWGTYRTAGGVAGSLSRDLDSLESLIGMAPDGPIAGALAQTFPGFSSAGDAFNSVVSRAAPQMRVPGSGATSDIEYEGMLRSFPRLINSEEGKRAILAIMRAKVDLDLQRSEVVSKYQNGVITDTQARQELDALNRMSVVPPGLKEALGIGTGAADDAPVTGKPPPPDRPPPSGISQEDWEWMTPEERAGF